MSYLIAIQKIDKFNIFVFACITSCLLPFVNAPIALGLGIGGALFIKNSHTFNFQFLSNTFLKVSIVLMGFRMSWSETMETSSSAIIITAFSVLVTLLLGIGLGKMLNVDKKTTLLITAGTAICGGSAIAAVSPVIQARGQQLTFALIVVFVLNAVALLIFPVLGSYLNLSQEVFGNWAAVAIHDTTSVVGAGEVYGNKALQIATTVKLTRALWIIPMLVLLSLFQTMGKMENIKIPWFILLFVLAMLFAHLFPQWTRGFEVLDWLGRRGMVIALFFIGCSMQLSEAKQAGVKPFILGIVLWVIISTTSLFALMTFY
jgi:uncharacterized integral membrane protein (TIGR00698 family)